MRNLAIIPARSGSKGLKDKNIKPLVNKPLLAYSIEAAKKSNIFDEIIVSTDSQKYADIAKSFNAKVPFLREKELATDDSLIWDVVRNIIGKFEKKGKYFDNVALLQPTSPLREDKDILAAYDKLMDRNLNAVVSVCEMDHSPLWSNTLPKDQSLVGFIKPDVSILPRQKLPKYYRLNGAIYFFKTDYIKKVENIYQEKVEAIIMSRERSIDVDTLMDFMMAEFFLKKLKK